MATPDLLFWNRIEPHPRTEDIKEPLRAKIRDPLWMLSRQWQLGEFQGEDAGKATSIKLSYQKHLPQNVIGRNGKKVFFSGKNQPLESIVERTSTEPDLFTKVEIGRQWLRFLEKYLSENQQEEIIQAFEESEYLQFKVPEQFNRYQKYEQADILCDKKYINLLESLATEQKIDGGKLIQIIANKHYLLSEYILGKENQEVDFIAERLLDWAKRIYNVNIEKNPFWNNCQLEHQFDLEIEESDNQIKRFKAEEYFGNELEWHQFDLTPKSNSNSVATKTTKDFEIENFQYPSEISYQGMPNSRWWELEDGAVNFGNITADSTSPANLVFSQFNLLYSNDWLMMPFEIERGVLCNVKEMIVADNFGIRTLVKHLHETNPDEKWGLFQLHDRNFEINKQNDTSLFIPLVIDDLQKSKPIEEINFLRDEMANMVWGVEKRVPNHLGDGVAADELAEKVKQYLSEIAEPNNREDFSNSAKVKYQIATTVPENWIPFIPVNIKNQDLISRQIQLQRASMPRVVNGYKPSRVRPKSPLLAQGLKTSKRKPFYLYEEEILRSGSIVKGQWKRVRWLNGQTIIWYGYEKTNGRGEGNSGLKFDQVLSKEGE